MNPTVSLNFQFNSPIEKVWHALTDADTLAKWVMPNDLKPVVGHQFQFRTEPTGWWDGIVNSEVLEVDEPHRLAYTWVSGGLSSKVVWTLEQSNGKTSLHLEQTGFESEDQSFNGAKYGWQRMAGELEKVLAEL